MRIRKNCTTISEFDIGWDQGRTAATSREELMRLTATLAFAAAALFGTAAQAQVNVKIGVMNDMSSLYADITGRGSVTAAKMAVEDFNPAAHGMKVEIIGSDHQK